MSEEQRVKKLESNRRWKAKHPLTDEQKETRNRKSREWRANHPGYDQIRWIYQKTLLTQEQRDKRSEYNRKYKKDNSGRVKEYNINYKNFHTESYREGAWKQMGIDWSYDRFLEMFESQKGICLGCGSILVKSRKEVVSGKRLAHLDHDHTTGKVRGILCAHCNQALGHSLDNPNTLRTLADYVERSRK